MNLLSSLISYKYVMVFRYHAEYPMAEAGTEVAVMVIVVKPFARMIPHNSNPDQSDDSFQLFKLCASTD